MSRSLNESRKQTEILVFLPTRPFCNDPKDDKQEDNNEERNEGQFIEHRMALPKRVASVSLWLHVYIRCFKPRGDDDTDSARDRRILSFVESRVKVAFEAVPPHFVIWLCA